MLVVASVSIWHHWDHWEEHLFQGLLAFRTFFVVIDVGSTNLEGGSTLLLFGALDGIS